MPISKSPCKRILIIGFKSAGKTTLGKKLSNQLNIPFFDTDELLLEKYQVSTIGELFKKVGVFEFRKLEKKMIRTYPFPTPCVISTGGGIVERVSNRRFLKRLGKVLFLNTSFDTILSRIQNYSLVVAESEKEKIKKLNHLYEKRLPKYFECADNIVRDLDGC